MEEVEAIAAELSPAYRPLPMFAAATGLRPEEWGALERRDVDRHDGLLTVRRTVSSGELIDLGKTTRSRRQVPLSSRALEALDQIPPRLDTTFVFAALRGRSVRPRQLPAQGVGASNRGRRGCGHRPSPQRLRGRAAARPRRTLRRRLGHKRAATLARGARRPLQKPAVCRPNARCPREDSNLRPAA